MRVSAWSYCILLGHVQLISLGGLLSFEMKRRRSGSRRESKFGGGTGGSGGKRKYDWNVLYERIDKKKKKLKDAETSTEKHINKIGSHNR